MDPMTLRLVGALVRALLQAFGGGAALFADSDVEQITGAVLSIVTVAWSIWEKVQHQPPAHS